VTVVLHGRTTTLEIDPDGESVLDAVLAVRADAPWKTAKDFVEDAKQHPGKINYGSSGNYGTMHVPMEILAQNAGVKLTHVPYTGAGPAVVALLGGQIQALSTGPATVLQHV
jgi:tripartite-type tricarboxylate transporter receptor subunit TctC